MIRNNKEKNLSRDNKEQRSNRDNADNIEMYRIAIVDDEVFWRDQLKKEIYSVMKELALGAYTLDEFTGPLALKAALGEGASYDLIFMDVNLDPDSSDDIRQSSIQDGLSLTSEIRRSHPRTRVALVSSHREFVFDGYEVEAVQFFVKPAKHEKLLKFIKKDFQKNRAPKKIRIRLCEGGELYLPLSEVRGVEQYYAKTYVYRNRERMQVTNSFRSLAEELPDPPFVRCHQSYIVNFEQVVAMERYRMIMEDKSEFPVSKKNYSEIRKNFDDYMLSKLLP